MSIVHQERMRGRCRPPWAHVHMCTCTCTCMLYMCVGHVHVHTGGELARATAIERNERRKPRSDSQRGEKEKAWISEGARESVARKASRLMSVKASRKRPATSGARRLMEPVMTITCGMDIRACDAYDACNGRVRGVQCSACVRARRACMQRVRCVHAMRATRAMPCMSEGGEGGDLREEPGACEGRDGL